MSHSKPFHCFDCDKYGREYSVHNDVWLKAWPDYHERKKEYADHWGKDDSGVRHPMGCLCLCFSCLEKRLGRRLTPLDFDFKYPINEAILFGLRLNATSPRGFQLAYQGGRPGVVTVELYEKWYELWVTEENGGLRSVSFTDLEDYTEESAYVDHVPNPTAVCAWAKANGLEVDPLSLELMVGRWSDFDPSPAPASRV